MAMKQCMIFGFVKVNNLLITGCQFGPCAPFEKLYFISAKKNMTSSATYKY